MLETIREFGLEQLAEEGDLEHARAVELWREGIAFMGDRGAMRQVADAFSGIGCVAAAWDAHRSALLLFGAADALRERAGTTMLWATDIAAVEQSLASLRQTLGEQRVATTLAEGRRLSWAEALAVAAEMAQTPTPTAPGVRAPNALTLREREVLQLLAAHHTDREIAAALFLSPRTVTWHVRSILAKLGAASRREAVARARANGLVQAPQP
jgi:DNA-binding CsgD family transcriptional regulator